MAVTTAISAWCAEEFEVIKANVDPPAGVLIFGDLSFLPIDRHLVLWTFTT